MGEDYDFGSYSVEFNAGMTRSPLDVSINDDDVLEGNENFILIINQSSLPESVTVDDRGEVIVTIVDDDRKLYNPLFIARNN